MDTVLVTGGTGYIARQCIAQLLDQGHSVRTTVRDQAKEGAVRTAIAEAVDPGDRLEVVVADLTVDDGWAEAVAACRFVLHPASPLGGAGELIAPARDGALRVLRAAHAAGVERVVLTSAANASSPTSYAEPGTTDEELWTDPDAPGLDEYRRSKTLAELAAWAFADEVGARALLTTVLPGAVFGPILGADNLGSVEVIGRVLRGEMAALPNIGFEVVDVRDIADLHVRAMAEPAAAGERFLGTGELRWLPDIAALLRSELGAAADRVPTATISDDDVRLLAGDMPGLRAILPSLGRRNVHTAAKAARLLRWAPRPADETIVACARSLLAHGAA
jgi:nucleoside-diphosphate-sugar epimerase